MTGNKCCSTSPTNFHQFCLSACYWPLISDSARNRFLFLPHHIVSLPNYLPTKTTCSTKYLASYINEKIYIFLSIKRFILLAYQRTTYHAKMVFFWTWLGFNNEKSGGKLCREAILVSHIEQNIGNEILPYLRNSIWLKIL